MGTKDSRTFGVVKITGVDAFRRDAWRFTPVEWSLDGEGVR